MKRIRGARSGHPASGLDGGLTRADKERQLRQRSRAIWLYGLSGAGKSTLANGMELRLHADGFVTHLLDGDSVRAGLNRDLGFGPPDRAENIRRAAEVARLFVQAGVIPIMAFITPTRALRELARSLVGAEDFIDVYVQASLETCARRDPKGLYARAGDGRIQDFTGYTAPFEPPESATLTIDTNSEPAEKSLDRLYRFVRGRLDRPVR
jgi:adenylylsulfate kinase